MSFQLFHYELHYALVHTYHVNAGSYLNLKVTLRYAVEELNAVNSYYGYRFAFGTVDCDEAVACCYAYASLNHAYAGIYCYFDGSGFLAVAVDCGYIVVVVTGMRIVVGEGGGGHEVAVQLLAVAVYIVTGNGLGKSLEGEVVEHEHELAGTVVAYCEVLGSGGNFDGVLCPSLGNGSYLLYGGEACSVLVGSGVEQFHGLGIRLAVASCPELDGLLGAVELR